MWYIDEEREYLSSLVYDFLNSLREGKVPKDKMEEFFDFVNNLDRGTEIQKRRFYMFYYFKSSEELETFSTIAEKEKCTYPAIKVSVNRIRSYLVGLKDEERENLIKIIK